MHPDGRAVNAAMRQFDCEDCENFGEEPLIFAHPRPFRATRAGDSSFATLSLQSQVGCHVNDKRLASMN